MFSDSDDEAHVINNATGRPSRSSRGNRYNNVINVTRTDSDSEDEPVSRRMATFESDSEEEDELDERGLSPRTRMSITGVRPQDLSDDSSEIEYITDEDEQLYLPVINGDSAYQDLDETFDEDLEREEAAAARYRLATDQEAQSPRNDSGYQNALPSPIFPSVDDSSSSDVPILSHSQTPIKIPSASSSDSDNSYNKENLYSRKVRSFSPRSSAEVPKIKSIGQKPPQAPVRRSTNKAVEKVSAEFYEKEAGKLSELREQFDEAEKLYKTVAKKLPDKGAQIRKRIDGLHQDIDSKIKYLSRLRVQRAVPKITVTKSPKSANDVPDWDQLSAGVNRIQPTNTGARGMATFNEQKALTLDSLKQLHSSLKGCPKEQVLASDPPGLKVKLMDHQKHALAWMSWREQQRPRGGILADDMGLGKTLTMISLVLASKNEQPSRSGVPSDSSDDEEYVGKKRKSAGAWNSKSRKDFYSGGTLVVCPASLLRQWEGEVKSKLSRPRLSVCVHHGSNRESKAKELGLFDMVVTTYNIVSRDDKKKGALYGVKWSRIILDEAHVVRNHKAQSSEAVSLLRGKYRWALTGTPIQNKELDVYALLKFLRCSPFDDLATWKTWIDNKSADGQERLNLLMKSLMLRRTKAQLQLNGKLNNLPKKDIRFIEMSLDTDEMNVYQRVMSYSRSLFAQFLFQRAEKDSDANFINDARKPTYKQIKDPNGAYFKMHEKFAAMAGHGKEVKSHEILVLLLRLRQICCHPGLIDSMLEDEGGGKMTYNDTDGRTPEIDLLEQLNRLSINNSTGSSGRSSSSRNEARLAKSSQNLLKRSNPVFNLKRPSSKMLKVLDILKSSVLKTKDKAIVVSQWTSVLDIMRNILEKEKLVTLSLNGSIPVKDRQDIVNEFNDPKSSKRILLLSLTAGGVGLNLVGANHLILMDLHWNPQLEAQAQDRIYRVGQKKDVIIYKIVCVETVEQRIKALQDRKLELADGVLTGKVSTKLSIDDLKGLFGM